MLNPNADPMADFDQRQFGLVIAYLLPGFVFLSGLCPVSPTLQLWLGEISGEGPTLGGFLFVTLASLGAGLIASTLRWLILDTFHHVTGLPPPAWRFRRLADCVEAFQFLVEIHYRYYQFYGNTAVAVVAAYVAWRCRGTTVMPWGWPEAGVLLLIALLLAGSRDTLRKYYQRAGDLLSDNDRP